MSQLIISYLALLTQALTSLAVPIQGFGNVMIHTYYCTYYFKQFLIQWYPTQLYQLKQLLYKGTKKYRGIVLLCILSTNSLLTRLKQALRPYTGPNILSDKTTFSKDGKYTWITLFASLKQLMRKFAIAPMAACVTECPDDLNGKDTH